MKANSVKNIRTVWKSKTFVIGAKRPLLSVRQRLPYTKTNEQTNKQTNKQMQKADYRSAWMILESDHGIVFRTDCQVLRLARVLPRLRWILWRYFATKVASLYSLEVKYEKCCLIPCDVESGSSGTSRAGKGWARRPVLSDLVNRRHRS